MSPTVFNYEGFRFFFFSAEEERMHIHITSNGAEAKFWIEPSIAIAVNNGFNTIEIKRLEKIIQQNEDKIKQAWHQHFRC